MNEYMELAAKLGYSDSLGDYEPIESMVEYTPEPEVEAKLNTLRQKLMGGQNH